MSKLASTARISGSANGRVFKVLSADEARLSKYPLKRCLLYEDSGRFIRELGAAGGLWVSDATARLADGRLSVDRLAGAFAPQPGDVVRVMPEHNRIVRLYRRGSRSNTLLATERCNSFCVMCSQPPRTADDGWLVDEIIDTLPLIDEDEQQIGLSGGEPTLLGDRLLHVLASAKAIRPRMTVHVLSNGRAFHDSSFARCVAASSRCNTLWGIPLYAATPDLHDAVVQTAGAWRETVQGLYHMGTEGARLEIRCVLTRWNLDALPELSYFLFRNLSFVEHVALMGLEPIGFARANWAELKVSAAELARPLADAVHFLANRGMSVSIYNVPLCMLPDSLRPFARQSISDWKVSFTDECSTCDLRSECCGFFAWMRREWILEMWQPSASGARG
jgi:His-Xaa-Ser system radical SAM maturase HxsC